jgi:hypothetical protein
VEVGCENWLIAVCRRRVVDCKSEEESWGSGVRWDIIYLRGKVRGESVARVDLK